LNRLQGGRNGLITGLGLMQVLLQSPEEIVERRVMGEFPL
jgi:hypothetical protein